jgi:uroporphyrin-III C-methyltransferase
MRRSGKLTLVGAGPGDAELISIKGMKAIQKAEVILYDALVSKELLGYARRGCKLVYVGKRKGKKEFAQEEINKLLVFYAARFNHVVRLKGGDPNVFGRGHEELTYAANAGVEVEVIPGISSAIAAPSAAGIPLTKRGVNESFWVITGTLSSGEMSNDIQLAARSSATVVILMGVTHLKEIASLFLKERSAAEPVAVIQEATLPEQKIVTGTTADIVQLVRDNGIGSPAVIVIGKVVEERKMLEAVSDQTRIGGLVPVH